MICPLTGYIIFVKLSINLDDQAPAAITNLSAKIFPTFLISHEIILFLFFSKLITSAFSNIVIFNFFKYIFKACINFGVFTWNTLLINKDLSLLKFFLSILILFFLPQSRI